MFCRWLAIRREKSSLPSRPAHGTGTGTSRGLTVSETALMSYYSARLALPEHLETVYVHVRLTLAPTKAEKLGHQVGISPLRRLQTTSNDGWRRAVLISSAGKCCTCGPVLPRFALQAGRCIESCPESDGERRPRRSRQNRPRSSLPSTIRPPDVTAAFSCGRHSRSSGGAFPPFRKDGHTQEDRYHTRQFKIPQILPVRAVPDPIPRCASSSSLHIQRCSPNIWLNVSLWADRE